jgi:predicted glycoside hydrolase/deacetylase ChbG (UPF0249 family)
VQGRRILITADDFGWTDGHNLAVERAARAGTLNRASLLANGAAFAGAVIAARRCPRLGVGVHLTLCEGRPLSEGAAAGTSSGSVRTMSSSGSNSGPPGRAGLGALLRSDGAFHDGLGAVVKSYARGRLDVGAVGREWRLQIERVLDAGLSLTHLDGHKHVHLLPPLLSLTIELAREYGVPYVRVPLEAPSLALGAAPGRIAGWLVLSQLARRARAQVRAAGLGTSDHFVGFARSGAMTRERLLDAVQSARPGLTEIMVHPALRSAQFETVLGGYAWAQSYRSEDEAAALCDDALRAALRSGS